jgi:four helix bundle protein
VSIPANIAEGKGRFSKKEFVHFLYNARGSLYEMMTLSRLALESRYLTTAHYDQLTELGQRVMSKLSGLVNSLK